MRGQWREVRAGGAELGLQLARVEHFHNELDRGLNVDTEVAEVVGPDTAGHRSPGDGCVVRGAHVKADRGGARGRGGADCGDVREGKGVAAAVVRQQ